MDALSDFAIGSRYWRDRPAQKKAFRYLV